MHDTTRKAIFIVLGVVFFALLGAWWYFGFSLDFMRFFAAEPDVTSPTPTVTADAWGRRVVCAPATQTVAPGAAATLTATGGSGTYEWFAPQGSPKEGVGSTFTVTYAAAGTKQVTVQSVLTSDNPDQPTIDNVACTIVVQ